MERPPRNGKRDNLTNKKLFSLSYTMIGVLEAAAGMFVYFYIMNDYGIRPTDIWYSAMLKGPRPNPWDIYNEEQGSVYDYGNGTLSLYGNTNYNVSIDDPGNSALYWDKYLDGLVDIRLFYAFKC